MTTTNRADHEPVRLGGRAESVDEQARRKGVRPIQSADDLAQLDLFESDEELEEFLAHVYASRRANLAWPAISGDAFDGSDLLD